MALLIIVVDVAREVFVDVEVSVLVDVSAFTARAIHAAKMKMVEYNIFAV